MFNINFANDWIQTADLWYWKQPLYQLSHNHYILLFAAPISKRKLNKISNQESFLYTVIFASRKKN